jgi:hypothetical protein
MKPNEQELRNEIAHGVPFTLVTNSGDRIKVRGHDWIILPPLEDEDGRHLEDSERSDFFHIWGNGRNYRWVAFDSINLIEAKAPES